MARGPLQATPVRIRIEKHFEVLFSAKTICLQEPPCRALTPLHACKREKCAANGGPSLGAQAEALAAGQHAVPACTRTRKRIQFRHLVGIHVRPSCMQFLSMGWALTLHIDKLIANCRKNSIELNQRRRSDPFSFTNTGLDLIENRLNNR